MKTFRMERLDKEAGTRDRRQNELVESLLTDLNVASPPLETGNFSGVSPPSIKMAGGTDTSDDEIDECIDGNPSRRWLAARGGRVPAHSSKWPFKSTLRAAKDAMKRLRPIDWTKIRENTRVMPGWGGEWGSIDGSKEHESLDFDPVNNAYWMDSYRHLPRTLRAFSQAIFSSKFMYRWILTVVIGVSVAASAQVVQSLIALLIGFRNHMLQSLFDARRTEADILIFFASYNAGLVLIAGFLVVFLEPRAAADGISEIKAYLNGSNVPNCFSVQTILVKLLGSIFASSAGLACGPEGPLIHIGAGIAHAVTAVDKIYTFLPWLPHSGLAQFHNDRDRREFIAAGAGAGIAAAFGAPIGGVLFALEEAASHLSPQLIWRILTSALVATFTLALIKANGTGGDISLAGLLSFGTAISIGDAKERTLNSDGTSDSVSALDAPIYVWELFLFIILGAVGGVLGGFFGAGFDFLTPRRPRSRYLKMLEVLLISLGTSYSVFFFASNYPVCRNDGSWTCTEADNWGGWCGGAGDNSTCIGLRAQCVNATGWVCIGGGNNGLACRGRGDCEWRGGKCHPRYATKKFGVRLGCPEGQYDELATLFFGSKEQSIVRMVTQAWPHEPFSNTSLFITSILNLFLMLITYGSPLPVGYFMPSWLVGASIGRLFGQLVKAYVGSSVYSGAYALAGAAAMLGGVQRTSISLVFIIVECTSNVHFLLPIVTTVMVANLVAQTFTKEGVFDISLRHRSLRFLPHHPDWLMSLCTVSDIMANPVKCLRTIDKVGNVIDVLRNCHHNGFPVLSLDGDSRADGVPRDRLEGLILRSHLRHLLGTRFMRDGSTRDSLWNRVTAESVAEVSLDGEIEMFQLIEYRRRKAEVSAVKEWEWGMFSSDDRERYVNLAAYMNAACYSVYAQCPVSRAYSIFRSLGLRHLPVVNHKFEVIGMLTRANFSERVLHLAIHSYYTEEELVLDAHGSVSWPRLHSRENLERQRTREPLNAGSELVLLGGPLEAWQSRLVAALELGGYGRRKGE